MQMNTKQIKGILLLMILPNSFAKKTVDDSIYQPVLTIVFLKVENVADLMQLLVVSSHIAEAIQPKLRS
jgi:hypothetical protein